MVKGDGNDYSGYNNWQDAAITGKNDHIAINGINHLFSNLEQVNIFRIFQESLTNIARHSQASQITVNIKRDKDHVLFNVEDNGKGFDLKEVWDREGRETGSAWRPCKNAPVWREVF